MSQDRSNSYSQVLNTFEHTLDRPIAFHPIFAKITGSINAGLFLSQAWYWQGVKNKTDHEGWFYQTQAAWTEQTLLSRREQETCRKVLKKLGILEEKRVGLPAQLFFRIRTANLYSAMDSYADDSHRSMSPGDTQDCTQPPILDCTQTPIPIRKQRLPETTTENTLFSDIEKPKPKNGKATRIPEDFAVTDKHRAWAKENNLPSPDSLIEQFRDYWTAKAGKESIKADWDAAFRYWIRNSLNFKGNGNEQSRQAIPERTKINKAALEGFREYEARRNSQPSDSNRGSNRRKTVSGGPDSVR